MRAETAMAATLTLAPPDRAHMVISATSLDVRQGLRDLMACALMRDLSEDCQSTTEIVLAEALNNAVEHSYARFPGEIEVDLRRDPDHLRFHIKDKGLPMPGAEPPAGHLPAVGTFGELPEGGFGWFLIRKLSCDLTYHREGNLNTLSFGVCLDKAA